jgi:hypothetical protein
LPRKIFLPTSTPATTFQVEGQKENEIKVTAGNQENPAVKILK